MHLWGVYEKQTMEWKNVNAIHTKPLQLEIIKDIQKIQLKRQRKRRKKGITLREKKKNEMPFLSATSIW